MSGGEPDWGILGRAIGLEAESLISTLGEPTARRTDGPDLWLAFEAPGKRLLVRCEASGDRRKVAAWILSFHAGPLTLREACEPLGLWPACAPDVAAQAGEPLVRRAIPGAQEGVIHSLTASVGGGKFQRIALFNEPPDWL